MMSILLSEHYPQAETIHLFIREGDYSKHIFWVLLCGPHIINSPIIAFHLLWGNRVKGYDITQDLPLIKFYQRDSTRGALGSVKLVWTSFSITNSPPVRSQQCPKVSRVLFVTLDAWQCALHECKICAICPQGKLRFHVWSETAWERNTEVSNYSQSPSLCLNSAGAGEIRVEADNRKTGTVSLPLVWEVHMWKTVRFAGEIHWNMGEKMLVSMATRVMATSVRAQRRSGIETPRIFVTLKRHRSL